MVHAVAAMEQGRLEGREADYEQLPLMVQEREKQAADLEALAARPGWTGPSSTRSGWPPPKEASSPSSAGSGRIPNEQWPVRRDAGCQTTCSTRISVTVGQGGTVMDERRLLRRVRERAERDLPGYA